MAAFRKIHPGDVLAELSSQLSGEITLRMQRGDAFLANRALHVRADELEQMGAAFAASLRRICSQCADAAAAPTAFERLGLQHGVEH